MEKQFTAENAFFQTTQMANKWFSDSCNAMMNLYDRQMKTMLNFYNSAFNQSGEEEHTSYRNMAWPFTLGTNFFRTWMKAPAAFAANERLLDLFTSQMREAYKPISEFNSDLLSQMQEDLKERQENWNELREKYNKTMEEEGKMNRRLVSSLQESVAHQMGNILELNKKFLQEMDHQVEEASNRNKKYWWEFSGRAENGEKEQEERRDGQTKKHKTEMAQQ